MSTKGQYIYFMRPVGMLGPIKIGCSIHADERLSTLSTWSPFKLEIIYSEKGDYRLEQSIHECFADYHSHREWFHPGDRLLKAIGKLIAGGNIASSIDFSDKHGSIRNVRRKPRRPVPDFQKELRSYQMRVMWAVKRGEKIVGETLWRPDDVWKIFSKWEGSWEFKREDGIRPTAEEFARLEEVIADPATHCQTRSQRFPKPASVGVAA